MEHEVKNSDLDMLLVKWPQGGVFLFLSLMVHERVIDDLVLIPNICN